MTLQTNRNVICPERGVFVGKPIMSIHLRQWGTAAALLGAFAIPHLVTQAQSKPVTPAAATSTAPTSTAPAVLKVLNLKITAYTSLPEETKSYGSPFITADGTYVHDGVVATNLLPFGTKVMIPSLFGDKVFTVDDRMSSKLTHNMDIWMATRSAAIVFGVHNAAVVVLAPTAASDMTEADAAATASETMSMAIGSKLPDPSVRQL